jgi:hypothetical protein
VFEKIVTAMFLRPYRHGREIGLEQQLETGILLHLAGGHAGMKRQQLHTFRALVKAEHAEIGDDPEHAASSQPGGAPGVTARQKAWAGDKIDRFHKPAFLVFHRHDHQRQAGDVISAAGSRQTARRALRITNERTVEIAVLVDLRAAHEADIDIAALQQQQHLGAAQHHVGTARAALLIG